MSLSNDPSNNNKPVVKDKNPHHYRKVGYSLIVISVALVLIGLLIWSIGSDWHFSTNIMAQQEVVALTPRSGYNIVLFDTSQPVGAKLKLLDTASTMNEAQSLKEQDSAQNQGSTLQVLIFNASSAYNLKKMADAEVYIQTPKTGYNVVLFDDSMPVGQKLTLGIHDESLTNATDYQTQQVDNLKGQNVKVLIFTSDFKNDLKMITGSSTPVGDYEEIANNMTNEAAAAVQTAENNTASVPSINGTGVIGQPTSQSAQSNQTMTARANQTMPASTNGTTATQQVNATATISGQSNATISGQSNATISGQSNATISGQNATTAENNANLTTHKVSKTISLNETVGINTITK